MPLPFFLMCCFYNVVFKFQCQHLICIFLEKIHPIKLHLTLFIFPYLIRKVGENSPYSPCSPCCSLVFFRDCWSVAAASSPV